MRVCSLFAGAGGIDIAFEQAGFTTVWANEFDKDACKTYRQNFPNVTLIEEDIRKVDAAAIPDFDILVGGFPCQPFSIVGRQKGFNDVRGNLFFDICRVVDAKQPRAIFLENVANLVEHDRGNTFKVIIEELTSRGYFVKHTVVDACNYGMPQHRTRTYIVCFDNQNDYDSFCFPEPTGLKHKITDIIDRNTLAAPELYFSPGTPKYNELDAAIDDVEQLYRFTDYGRVQKSRDGISFTLKANMGTWYDREPVIKDNYGIRKLAPLECFKLQGFPNTFLLDGISKKSAYKQAGNSVCVPVIRQIADNLKKVITSRHEFSDTLVGPLKNRKQLSICFSFKFYHLPRTKIPGTINAIKYVAIYQSARIFGADAGIQYIGKVDSVQFMPRCCIQELPKNSHEEYCKINISTWYKLSRIHKPTQTDLFYTCSHGEFQEEETWQIV